MQIRRFIHGCFQQQYARILTHWGRDKMAANFQTTYSNGYFLMKMYEFRLKFHWSLSLVVELAIFQRWFRKQRLGVDKATSHYLKQWRLAYWRIYASLGLNDVTGTPANMNFMNFIYQWPFSYSDPQWIYSVIISQCKSSCCRGDCILKILIKFIQCRCGFMCACLVNKR